MTGPIVDKSEFHGRQGIDDPDLFSHILRTQLKVTAEQFWAAVDHGTKPERLGFEPEPLPKEAIPFDLARNLLMKAGVSQSELARMSKDEAIARCTSTSTPEVRDPAGAGRFFPP